ncbi:MAG TPA: MaoC family dehydratase [Caulobacteraceae bacterium]|nr:MaoC family dehydratase [Caulobacteraceae bacterium]
MSAGPHLEGRYLEDLAIGQSAERKRIVTADNIEAFAAVTGDDNPVHLDEAYAAKTSFGGRIAHGMLSAGYISAVLGGQLPGPGAIYVSQTLNFRRPVRIDEVTARVTVSAIDERRGRVTFATVCEVGGKTVTEGEAVVIASKRAPSENPAA